MLKTLNVKLSNPLIFPQEQGKATTIALLLYNNAEISKCKTDKFFDIPPGAG